MDAEQAGDPDHDLLGRFGYPRETPQNMVPMNPEMKKGMAAVNAHIEAQKAKAEAKSNTPEGRKNSAEAELAERKRKENNWLSRVIIDRGNGWKPIWGTAEDEELRIYTLVDGGEHRFWGIKPIGMGIDDFWDKYDPEVRRYEDRQQETPVNPDEPVGLLIEELPRSLPPEKAAAKSKKRQKTPEVSPTHRVRKSTAEPPKVNKNTRKSLAHKFDARNPGLGDQEREVPVAAHANGRRTRNKAAVTASDAQQELAIEFGGSAPSKRPRGRPAIKAKPAVQDNTPSLKRPRGRLPAKGKPTERPPKQKKTPAIKGNARVTKSSQRPSAPSTHKMRTRGEGPAELLQL